LFRTNSSSCKRSMLNWAIIKQLYTRREDDPDWQTQITFLMNRSTWSKTRHGPWWKTLIDSFSSQLFQYIRAIFSKLRLILYFKCLGMLTRMGQHYKCGTPKVLRQRVSEYG
jgi:hypothetical protein